MKYLLVILSCITCHAANYYVLDGGTGDGSSWSAAADNLPAVMTRGDTYYIGDGAYGTWTLDDAASGTTWIYIVKATTGNHGTETGWNVSYGDGQATLDLIDLRTAYWEIDGGFGNNDESRGIKIDYNGLYGNISVFNSYIENVHHIVLRRIECVQTTQAGASVGLYYWCNRTQGTQGDWTSPNLIVDNCYMHDLGGLHLQLIYGNYAIITNNYFSRSCQKNDASHKESCKWDDTNSYVRVVGNVFKDWAGYSVTGCLVVSGGDPGMMQDWVVANNVFQLTSYSDLLNAGNRLFGGDDSSSTTRSNFWFINNTIIGVNHVAAANVFTFGTWTADKYATNNLFVDCDGIASINTTAKDYNAFYNCDNYTTNGFNDLQLTANPLISASDWRLSTDVTGVSIVAKIMIDRIGNVRTDPWSIGAYEWHPSTTISTTITNLNVGTLRIGQ